KTSCQCLRWFRQDGGLRLALLVCTITFNMVEVSESNAIWLDGIETQRVTGDNYQPTEPSNMFWRSREYVKISCPAPKVDEFSPGLRIYNVLGRNWCRWYEGCGTAHAKHTWPRRLEGLIEIKPLRKPRITDFTCD